ncbi:aminotransferase [Marinicauda pacifica]|jgi:alanine-synthesizing transaminase|uniref:Aminotransferase n=1 Tax=Marinicauda pacifica TaxID=1133559 RepID=A0A4S2HBN8_9PROT|nr:LL-diaminopimelate aminotransferase [Marinicauda pacifica]TGY92912.1 LL-diaminopimelate aminotransferase [Marinicauda pacifica]GGE41283.1 aminotransferase [Marinicauda pacifica]
MTESTAFYRERRLPPYVFAEVNRMKLAYRHEGRDIIDFGMGNPDLAPAPHIIDKLKEAASDPRAHRYSASQGIPALRKALARYYARRFDVSLNPDREVCVTLGSKEGLANLAQAVTAPGDVILVPDPSYPIHMFGFIIAGAAVRPVAFENPENFLREAAHACRRSIPAPSALVLNFPSNPTAQVVDLDFYREAVKLAKANDLVLISDLAYSEIWFEGDPPPSILQVPGARDVAVEFTSMSKTYSMPGWRIGFAAGSARLVDALKRVKSYLDYGAFTPVQVAAIAALDGPQDNVEKARGIYRVRRDVLVESFTRAGFPIPAPPATMFAWTPIPERFADLGSVEFSKLLLEKTGVAVAPGLGFGERGDSHVRLALVENEQRIRQAARQLKPFFSA